MLEKIREHSFGFFAKFLFSLIAISFIISGGASYLFRSKEINLASAGDYYFSYSEAYRIYKSRVNFLSSYYKGDISSYSHAIKKSIVEEESNKLLFKNFFYDDLGVLPRVSQVRDSLKKNLDLDDSVNYASVIKKINQGIGRNRDILTDIESSLSVANSLKILQESFFVGYNDFYLLNYILQKTRNIKYTKFELDYFLKKIKDSDVDSQAYYQENIEEFFIPETFDLEFLSFNEDYFSNLVSVSENEAKDFYDSNADSYVYPELRSVSSILIKDKETSEIVLKRLQAGELFSDLKKEFSLNDKSRIDSMSYEDYPKLFRDKVFALKKSEFEILETEFGSYILHLESITPLKNRSYDEVKKDVILDLKNKKILKTKIDFLEDLGDALYESPDSLDSAAKLLSLPVKSTGYIDSSGLKNIFDSDEVNSLIYSSDFREKAFNSDLIEKDGKYFAFRIKGFKDKSYKNFEEVKSIALQKAKEKLAQDKAVVFVDKLSSDSKEDLSNFDFTSLSLSISSNGNTDLPKEVKSKAFLMNMLDNNRIYVESNNSYYLILLESVSDVDQEKLSLSKMLESKILDQQQKVLHIKEINALSDLLRDKYKLVLNEDNIDLFYKN